ncbi:MAG: ZIP family metal transporter [Candidatus Peregrinibacteria bacterium]|nr:ZIP family metal transporter [Candidatus Peregrinibacteria bacterium]MCB9808557.1 ZIP family metal transporter [Candidatus Peribacteria bacterium]
MHNPILPIILSVLAVSAISLVGVVLLSLTEKFLKNIMLLLVSFSTGAMLGNVFFHMLPEIAQQAEEGMTMVLIGLIASFIIETFIHWRHCHDVECAGHIHPVGPLVIMGDAAHNMIDGALIATAYVVSMPLGIATTLAVLLHEIPQEIGDFAVLLHSGMSKGKALALNFASALTALLGAAVVIILSVQAEGVETILLPLAAGNFLYIAGSDLIPELHKETRISRSLLQLLCILAGVGLLFVLQGGSPVH